jgi:hypothetical protein
MFNRSSVPRALLIASLIAVGCTASPTDPETADARDRWRDRDIVNYEVQFRQVCFCVLETTAPVILQVRNRALVSVTRVSDGAAVPPAEWSGRYYTVDEMFALIQESRAKGAATVRASYDPVLGYPTEVYIDQDERVADEERSFELTNLREK